MPPTDCFEDAGAGCTSMSCVPSTSVPECHGTDPDLSAPTPLPSGVAAAGLDLSPVMGPAVTSLHGVSTKAKRKLRGSPARAGGAGGGPVSPMAARLSRGFPPLGIRPSSAAAAVGSVVPCPKSSCCIIAEQGAGGDTSPAATKGDGAAAPPPPLRLVKVEDKDERPPALAPLRPAAVGSSASPPAASICCGEDPSRAATAVSPGKPQQEDGRSNKSGNVSACGDLRPPQVQQLKKKPQMDINDMMHKARKASDNIRLLLHAKRCEGGNCQVPGCASARQLVEHMRGCHLTREARCSNLKCLQAQKMLRHYAECNRRKAVGGRYCLVCSLVARSATANSNVMAPPASSGPVSGPSLVASPQQEQQQQQQQRRQPLGYLGPDAAPGCGSSLQQQGSKKSGKGAGDAGLPSPVAISRCRRGGGIAQQQQRMSIPKDGSFVRPLPRMRRGSWGGYDRMRYLRRARFDSIPEEVPEEDCDCEEEDYDAVETASDAGSKSTAGDASSTTGSTTGETRNKTLLSSISL